jgi:hypothetical protein
MTARQQQDRLTPPDGGWRARAAAVGVHGRAGAVRLPLQHRPSAAPVSPAAPSVTPARLLALQQLAGNRATAGMVVGRPVVQREPIANGQLPPPMQACCVEGSATRVPSGGGDLYFFGCGAKRAGVVEPAQGVLSMLEDAKWRDVAGSGLNELALKKGGKAKIISLIEDARAAMDGKTAAMCTSGYERSAFAIFAVLSATVGYKEAAAAICANATTAKRRTCDMFDGSNAWLNAIAGT